MDVAGFAKNSERSLAHASGCDVVTDFAPTGLPYASPGQRPGLWRDQDDKAPTGAVLAGFGESFVGPPRWGWCRNLRHETPGDAWGYLRAAPLGRRKEQKPTAWPTSW